MNANKGRPETGGGRTEEIKELAVDKYYFFTPSVWICVYPWII
jgi:hypothetical protein